MNVKELLSHNLFVQSLARSLVADEHKAADIAQDTWTAVLATPPSRDKPFRAWLARVTRNFAFMTYRDEARRKKFYKAMVQQREFPSPGGTPSSDEMAAKLETRRNLIEAVLELDEPYRSVIMMRYYEGLKPGEIARRLETPTETVRTRLKRGIENLKSILDSRYPGGRRAWCLAVLPVIGLDGRESVAAAGSAVGVAAAGGTKLILATATALTLLVSLITWHILKPDTESESAIPMGETAYNEEETVIVSSLDFDPPAPEVEPMENEPEIDTTLIDKVTDFYSSIKSRYPGLVRISGTITVTDDRGVEYPSESGTFELGKLEISEFGKHWSASSTWGYRVQVIDGKWSTSVPPDSKFRISELVLGERPALVRQKEDFEGREDVPIALKAIWPTVPSTVLHVVDFHSGKELDEIEIVRGVQQIIYDHPYGEKYEVLFESIQSPLELKDTISAKKFASLLDCDWRLKVDYFVKRPGYAWSKVEVDFISGGEHIVRLKKSGGIKLEIKDIDQEKIITLGICHANTTDDIISRRIRKNKVHEIPSFPVGKYTAYAELGEFGIAEKVRLAETDFEVKADRDTYVTLLLKRIDAEVSEPSKIKKVPFAGTLSLPEVWFTEGPEDLFTSNPMIMYELLEQSLGVCSEFGYMTVDVLKTEDENNRHYKWDAGLVQPGYYKITVEMADYITCCQVEESGTTDIKIELGSPATVNLSVLDESTGLPADLNTISWMNVYHHRMGGFGSHNEVFIDSETRTFKIRALAETPILISLPEDKMYVSRNYRDTLVVVQPGMSSHVLKVLRAGELMILFKVENSVLPADYSWERSLKLVENDEEKDPENRHLIGDEKGGLHYHPLKPGMYRFRVASLEGFRPIPAQDIVVNPGECTEHVIQLEYDN